MWLREHAHKKSAPASLDGPATEAAEGEEAWEEWEELRLKHPQRESTASDETPMMGLEEDSLKQLRGGGSHMHGAEDGGAFQVQ